MHHYLLLIYLTNVTINDKPVISLTVWNTSNFLASRGGMFLNSSLWGIKTWCEPVYITKTVPGDCSDKPDNYPRIPVTRKWRLPWIFVQLMKLSMLLESTVCLCSAPVPSHTKGTTQEHHLALMTDKASVRHIKYLSVSTFWAESTAELTLPVAFSLHLHLSWRTNAHTGATVHYKMGCRRKKSTTQKIGFRGTEPLATFKQQYHAWYHCFTCHLANVRVKLYIIVHNYI